MVLEVGFLVLKSHRPGRGGLITHNKQQGRVSGAKEREEADISAATAELQVMHRRGSR